MTLFEMLVEATKETEAQEFCPLVIYNTFFNTATLSGGGLIIDFEEFGIRGEAGFIYDSDDLGEFLKRRRIKPENFKKAIEKANRATAKELLTR